MEGRPLLPPCVTRLRCVHYKRVGTDESFDSVRYRYRDSDENRRISSEDTHADNQGGPVPEGAWRFCMHSTAKPMDHVKHAIPNTRGDNSFACNEECFAAIRKQVSYDDALEHFPLKYSKFTKSQASLESSARTVVKLQPELLVIIDNQTPAERGVIIARLPTRIWKGLSTSLNGWGGYQDKLIPKLLAGRCCCLPVSS